LDREVRKGFPVIPGSKDRRESRVRLGQGEWTENPDCWDPREIKALPEFPVNVAQLARRE
jgi:hypothetical protein